MYDGVVTPEFMDDYGQVQNGDYPGQGYGNRYVVKVKGHKSCHKPYSVIYGFMHDYGQAQRRGCMGPGYRNTCSLFKVNCHKKLPQRHAHC